MSIPVISDGFYDLLNEVYKTYDPNFQVGSYVIDFKAAKTAKRILAYYYVKVKKFF